MTPLPPPRPRFSSIIGLLALLSAFPPLATDMYLPALPLLQHQWGAELVEINLTLVAFFLTYCAFLLVYGPLSDRWGRKPPLLAGVGLFVLACLLCAASRGTNLLIAGRILQGAGAAAASSIVFAICKDRFGGMQRQRVFIQIGVIVAAAPMIAPILGGWIIHWFSWRWIFLLQAFLGTIAFFGVLAMGESLVTTRQPGFSEVAAGYLRLAGNRGYRTLLLTLTCTCVPVFAFIGGSADLYISRLGYNERQFGFFFAFNALAFVLAPLTFSRVSRRVAITGLMGRAFAGMLVGSLCLLTPLLPDPWRLTLPMFAVTFSFSLCRPAGNNLILEQVDRDAGAASSLMVFSYFMVGALAMWFYSFAGGDKIRVLGWMGAVSAVAALAGWLGGGRRIAAEAERRRSEGISCRR